VRSEEVDLRYTSVGCTSHPIVRLSNIIPSLASEGVDEVKIIFKEDDIPREALKYFLLKYNYSIESFEELDRGFLRVIARRIS
jgi:hypothetical protein